MNGRYLTVEDVEKHAILAYDVHKAPTRVVSIENTMAGTIVPLEDLRRLKTCKLAMPVLYNGLTIARLRCLFQS